MRSVGSNCLSVWVTFGLWGVKMVKSGALTLTAMVRFGIGFTAGGF